MFWMRLRKRDTRKAKISRKKYAIRMYRKGIDTAEIAEIIDTNTETISSKSIYFLIK